MNLSTQLHLMAGLGAVALGAGVLASGTRRLRNRLFGALCGSLAVWNLGIVALWSGLAPGLRWDLLLLSGGCTAAPLAVHFALVVADLRGAPRGILLGISYAAGVGLWLAAWFLGRGDALWNLTAIFVLGALLVVALVILTHHVVGLPAGRERRTFRLVLAAGVAAVVGGLSDFAPRDLATFPKVGPVFVLLFLLIVSAVVVRRRFLDVDVYLARAAALVAGATGAALFLLGVTRVFGTRFLPLLVASVVLLAAAGPLGRLLLSRTEGLLRGENPLADALVVTSRKLPLARDADEVWAAIDEGRRGLPADVRLLVYLRSSTGETFQAVYPAGVTPPPPEIDGDGALPRLLERFRSPLTRRLLEIEIREEAEGDAGPARTALDRMVALGSEMTVPLFGDGSRLLGWLSIGGGAPEHYLRGEVAAALLAVGQQAVASLERIEAMVAARRREALAAVGEMAAGLAHEVRNPVAAIRGAAQAIAPRASADQAREMLEVIQEETERLGRVVGEFLDYARPASPRRERVDLGALARKVARDAGLAGSGLRIEVEVDPGAPAAQGDPDQIRRAFENLARNAAEATGPGGRLTIRVYRAAQHVAVRFQDDGPGIPEDQIASVFQPFHTNRPGGTGLGLALVHRIVEAHGGEISVEGRAGAGAAFTLVFPAA